MFAAALFRRLRELFERISEKVASRDDPSRSSTPPAGQKSGTHPAVSAEIETIDSIRQISSALAGVEGITGVGPLEEDGKACLILARPDSVDSVPETVRVQGLGEVRLRVVPDEGEARLFMGPTVTNAIRQFPGPVMGGDPVRNDAFTDYGTIAFGVDASAQTMVEGNACAGQILGCSHVFFDPGGDTLSTPLHPGGFQMKWQVGQASPHYADVAGATPTSSSIDIKPKWLRGLREITGVEFPPAGVRVSKYGQVSGLTSGRVMGPVQRTIGGKSVFVRFVKRRFAQYGDSGAAVVTGDRKLVGLIFAGNPTADESYFLQAWTDPSPVPNGYAAFRIENF